MTKQRRLIYDIIQGTPHISAEQIYLAAKQKMPQLALGTVYRNLRLMVESGEILQFAVPNGTSFYDKTISEHEHMVCDRCGKIIDLPELNLKNLLETQCDIQVDRYQLSIEGRCSDCCAAEDKNQNQK